MQQVVDITKLAVLGEQFPPRLMQLGFRLMQAVDDAGWDQYRYVLPPVCEVPAGPFWMGSDHRRDPQIRSGEHFRYQNTLVRFQIAAYPMTVIEYLCGVQAGAVSAPAASEDIHWELQLQCPDCSVCCISRELATAYSAWFAKVTGEGWRLPTEIEWEKAARGTDGRIYPWGDVWEAMRANTTDGGAGKLIPVGSYASQGDASPYGVHDLAGNVWEWTRSVYDEYSHVQRLDEDDTASTRVLRGGSWKNLPVSARAASRYGFDPRSRSVSCVGMRLVCDVSGENSDGQP